MSDLPEDLRLLAAGAPEVANWPGLVRAQVRARQRRRRTACAAAAVAMVGVAGMGVVLAGEAPTERLVAVAPVPEPSATPTPDPSPAPAPTEEPSPVPSPQPQVERTAPPPSPASAAPQDSAAASPTAVAYPPARNTVTLEITLSPERPVVGEPVTITVVARGDKATPYLTQFSYDRGRRSQNYPVAGCAPPEPVAPEPGSSSDSVTFTYTEEGPETISVRAESPCSYYPGSSSATRDVQVAPAPEPSGSPAA